MITNVLFLRSKRRSSYPVESVAIDNVVATLNHYTDQVSDSHLKHGLPSVSEPITFTNHSDPKLEEVETDTFP